MAPPGPRVRPPRAFLLPALFVGTLFVMLWLRRPQEPQPLPGRNLATFAGDIMGTTYAVRVIASPDPLSPADHDALAARIQAALDEVNEKMSTYRAESELSRFNTYAATEPFSLSAETREVIAAAILVSEQSGGAFDVTIRPLVEAWGFGVDESMRGPTDAEAAILMADVGSEKLHLDDDAGTLAKDRAGVQVDLSAIAKGYGVDRAALAIEAQGFTDYMVEVGGEVRARGMNERGQVWRIGIEKPDAERGVLQEIIALKDISLATSGDYRNYYEVDGERISHTIDARSGQPIRHPLASVSVIHPDAMWADAYATALNVLGPEEGLALAETLHLPVLMLVRTAPGEFTVRSTPAFDAYRVTEAD